MTTLELKSYSIEIAELLIIARCVEANPKLSGVELSRMLGIGKSSFYRKIKIINTDTFRLILLELGYPLSEIDRTRNKYY